MQFRQFYASKKFNDEFLTIWNEGNFGDERGKLSAGNFLITVLKLFDELDKFDIGSLNLHLDKENNVIFSFLTNNLKNDIVINDSVVKYNNNQLISLRVMHSKMSEIFNTHGSSYLNDLFDNKIKRLNLNNKNNNSVKHEIALNDKDFIKVKRIYNKKIRFNRHISNFEFHLNNNPITSPKSLFYYKFPWPMFKDNDEFINKYYDIIEDAQKKIMNLNLEELKKRNQVLDVDLDKLKTELKDKDRWNGVDDMVEDGGEIVSLEDVFKECNDIEEKRFSDHKLVIFSRLEKH